MSNDFEIVESSRNKYPKEVKTDSEIKDVLVDNMGSMVEIAKELVDIERMKVQSDAILAKMAEDRKMLMAEAEAYALRKSIDTKNVIDRMKMVQELLRDFYSYNQKNDSALSGEEFTKIISDVLNTMER